jgi:hypothetical protein
MHSNLIPYIKSSLHLIRVFFFFFFSIYSNRKEERKLQNIVFPIKYGRRAGDLALELHIKHAPEAAAFVQQIKCLIHLPKSQFMGDVLIDFNFL